MSIANRPRDIPVLSSLNRFAYFRIPRFCQAECTGNSEMSGVLAGTSQRAEEKGSLYSKDS